MKHLSITNKSGYPMDEIMPIMRAAYRSVKPEITVLPAKPLPVTLEHTRSRTWMCRWGHSRGQNTARILFAKPGHKFRDTAIGPIELRSMTEVMLAVSAWTFAAILCRPALGESCAKDALQAYRANPTEIDGAIAGAVQAKKDKASEEFSSMVFDGIEKSSLDYKLSQIEKKEKAWQRKLKLATTKLKTLRRRRSALLAADKRKQRRMEAQVASVALPPITQETK